MEPKSRYHGYVLVEAVNLDAVFDDTSQLSVVRGSSFLVKEAIESFAKSDEFTPVLKRISSGASSGLFGMTADTDLDTLCQNIQGYLNQHMLFQLATFCVVSCGNIPFSQAQTVLNAKLRQQQLCTTRVSTVAAPLTPATQTACAYNGVLPATEQSTLPGDSAKQTIPLVSTSVQRRFEYGREKRQYFYAEELTRDVTKGLTFYNNLQDIAKRDKHRLNGKVAILYVDGNQFGRIRRKHVTQPEHLTDFDDSLKHKRADLLTDILDDVVNNKAGFTHCVTDKHIRFETLLWGGDECLFVVPAWAGLDVLQAFYRTAQGWFYPDDVNAADQSLLSHAAGLVFCRDKTPIKQMRALAKDLAEDVKEKPGGRSADHFDYLVLESVDYSSDQKYPDFLAERYPAAHEHRTAMLSPCADWASTKAALQGLLPKVGKGAVYRLAFAAASGDLAQVNMLEKRLQMLKGEKLTTDLLSALASLLGQADAAYTALESSDLSIAWRWIHLVDLWDYLDVEDDKEVVQNA